MPDLARPFKVRGLMVGAPVSAVVYLVMMTQLAPEAIVTGIAWCAAGLAVFAVCRRMHGDADTPKPAAVATEEPAADERARMDREFRIWAAATGAAVVVALALYAVPHLL